MPKSSVDNNLINKALYPLILQSYMLVENNSYKYLVLKLKTNKQCLLSSTPNIMLLPPKAKTLIKFDYHLLNQNQIKVVNSIKVLFEVFKIRDYKTLTVEKQALSGIDVPLENNIIFNEKFVNGITSYSNNCENINFAKNCKLDIIYSKDINLESNRIPIKHETNTMTRNLSSKQTYFFESRNKTTNSELNDVASIKSKNDDDLIKEIIPKNLKKEQDYLNEKLSNLKFQCSSLEGLVIKEKQTAKKKFQMLLNCNFIISIFYYFIF